MKKKSRLIFLLVLCVAVSLCGCRKKAAETESETETQTVTETESETEKETQKETKKETEKSTTTSNKTTSTEKTTVKPSTVKSNSSTGSSSTKPSTSSTTPSTSNNTAATQQCPYCYQQISTAPNGDGTTVYSVHVAQEKAWADTYGYGTDTPQQTEAPEQNANDSAQCPYCYQWFSISDGSYNAHINSETSTPADSGGAVSYTQCPYCGNLYPTGTAYDTHVCPANQ